MLISLSNLGTFIVTRTNIGQVGVRFLSFMQIVVFIIRTTKPRELEARWAEGVGMFLFGGGQSGSGDHKR